MVRMSRLKRNTRLSNDRLTAVCEQHGTLIGDPADCFASAYTRSCHCESFLEAAALMEDKRAASTPRFERAVSESLHGWFIVDLGAESTSTSDRLIKSYRSKLLDSKEYLLYFINHLKLLKLHDAVKTNFPSGSASQPAQ